jgi:hypothetical protein
MEPAMTRLILPCLAALMIASAAQAQTITITGQNAGTYNGTRTCDRATATCTINGTTTTPSGATGIRNRSTTWSQGTGTSTLSGTRPNGREFSRTTTITR